MVPSISIVIITLFLRLCGGCRHLNILIKVPFRCCGVELPLIKILGGIFWFADFVIFWPKRRDTKWLFQGYFWDLIDLLLYFDLLGILCFAINTNLALLQNSKWSIFSNVAQSKWFLLALVQVLARGELGAYFAIMVDLILILKGSPRIYPWVLVAWICVFPGAAIVSVECSIMRLRSFSRL